MAAGLLLIVFLGVMAANQFLDRKRAQSPEESVEFAGNVETGRLRSGQKLPEVPVVGIDGMSTGILAFTRDGDLLILFVSAGCQACSEVAMRWSLTDSDQSGPEVVGLWDLNISEARMFAKETNFKFPLLCDTGGVFLDGYSMDVYPSVVGVRRGGEIAFVEQGIDGGLSLSTVTRRLREP